LKIPDTRFIQQIRIYKSGSQDGAAFVWGVVKVSLYGDYAMLSFNHNSAQGGAYENRLGLSPQGLNVV